jgi:hypothetical protein
MHRLVSGWSAPWCPLSFQLGHWSPTLFMGMTGGFGRALTRHLTAAALLYNSGKPAYQTALSYVIKYQISGHIGVMRWLRRY